MSKIKRYAVRQIREESDGYYVDITEHPEGEWVRWEDVKKLLHWIINAETALTLDQVLGISENDQTPE